MRFQIATVFALVVSITAVAVPVSKTESLDKRVSHSKQKSIITRSH